VCINSGIPTEQLDQTAFRSLTGMDLLTYTQPQYCRLLGSHLGRVLHQRLHREIRPNHVIQEQQQQQQQEQHDDDEMGGSPLIFQELQNVKIEKEFGDFESIETSSPHPNTSFLYPPSLIPHTSPSCSPPFSLSPHPSPSSLSPHSSPSSLSPHSSPSSLSPHPSPSYSPPFSLPPHPSPSLTPLSPRPSSSYSPPFLPPHPSPSYSPPSSLSPHPSPSNSPPTYPSPSSTSSSPPSLSSPIESESGLGVIGEGDKMAFCFALRKIKVRGRNREREPKNVEFLCRLLCCNERKITNSDFVQWEDKSQATFRLMKNNLIALVWGRRRQFFAEGNKNIDDVLREMRRARGRRRPAEELEDLTYNNFARGLRYHYNSDFIRSVVERQLVYQWGPKALEFMRSEAETLRSIV
ncbi:hypothetical protein Pcinc_008633, partial [Petrolisthes cinctipes]